MIILGIDPGTATTGYGVIEATIKNSPQGEKLRVFDYGCIDTDPFYSPGDRLKTIHNGVCRLMEKHKPDLVSIENVYFFKNLKTAMPVSQAKGVILLAAAKKKIPIFEFTPLQVKMTVAGYGKAEKKQVKEMVVRLLNLEGFDAKKNGRKKDDASDALGVALCAALKNRFESRL